VPIDHQQPSDDVDADAESVARTIALRKLTAKACTRYELDQALKAKNVPEGVIDGVLDRLQEVGLVDDASFAVDWVASRQQRRHLSRRFLRRELQAKGIEPSHIDSALDRVDRSAELTSARDLVERKRAAMMDYRAKFSIGGWPEYLAGADSMQASRPKCWPMC
jgi:regulatory protein